MNNLNKKTQSFKAKMKVYCGVATFMALIAGLTTSQAMNLEEDELRNLQNRPFYIKNKTKQNAHLAVTDISTWDRYNSTTVHGKQDLPIKDTFILEINHEGIRIKNTKTEKYLIASGHYVAGNIAQKECKYIGVSNVRHAGSYFNIYRYNEGLVITTKDHEYVSLTEKHTDRDKKPYLVSYPIYKRESLWEFLPAS